MRGMLDSGIVLQGHARLSRHEALPFFVDSLWSLFMNTQKQGHHHRPMPIGVGHFSLFCYHP